MEERDDEFRYEFVTYEVYRGHQMEEIQPMTGNMGCYLAEESRLAIEREAFLHIAFSYATGNQCIGEPAQGADV